MNRLLLTSIALTVATASLAHPATWFQCEGPGTKFTLCTIYYDRDQPVIFGTIGYQSYNFDRNLITLSHAPGNYPFKGGTIMIDSDNTTHPVAYKISIPETDIQEYGGSTTFYTFVESVSGHHRFPTACTGRFNLF